MSPYKSSVDCPTCELIVSVAQTIAENATDFEEFIGALNASCTVLFPGDASMITACETLADDAAQLLPWIDKQLRTLAWDIPETFCSVFVPVCTNPCCASPYTPEQVHLSLTGDMSEMRVVWVTLNATATSTVQYDRASANPSWTYSVTGTTRTYTFGGWLGVIHVATMTRLSPATAYSYRVGDASGGWSDVYNFTTLPTNVGTAARPLVMLSIGDMAYDVNSDETVATMTSLVAAGAVDVMIHSGDISYADGEQPHWDMFWRKVQGIAGRIPYMTVAGNHELWANFIAYQTRVSMPNENATANMYYSIDIGSVHVWMGNTETDIDTADMDATQVAAMAADLAAVNRSVTPWVLVTGHRPLYCTNSKSSDCKLFADILRFQAESTFRDAGVDLVINAHMHSYERTWPVYAGTPLARDYSSPAAPVYIVNGAGGNREGNEQPHGDAAWSAWSTSAIGYGLLTVAGPHALTAEFYAANGTLLDSITLTK